MNALPVDRQTPITLKVVDQTGAATRFNAERFGTSLERNGVDQNLASEYVQIVGQLLTSNNVQSITTNDLSNIATEVLSDAKKNGSHYQSAMEFGTLRNNVHNISIFAKFIM